MPTKTSLLFSDETVDQITDICQAKDGLSRTRVVALAIDRLHAAVCRPAAAGTSTSTAAVPVPLKRRTAPKGT
jgi:hypothetical protein